MSRNKIYLILFILLFCSACSTKTQPIEDVDSDIVFVRNSEAREDSIKLALAYKLMNKVDQSIVPNAETTPVSENANDDAADDPAFWYNVSRPDSSLIFGTNKKGGVYAYDLDGNEKAFYPEGFVNNIDIRSEVKIADQRIDVLGGSNRSNNSILLMQINPDGSLSGLLRDPFLIDTTEIDEVYGFSMYKDEREAGYAIINGKNGRINIYKIGGSPGDVKLEKLFSWKMATQPEGMVVDDERKILFIGEEQTGIWKVEIKEGSEPVLIEDSQKSNNPAIEFDIEGLAIYKDPETSGGFLLASIQGSFTYALFTLNDENRYISSFKIQGTGEIDGVEETDGLEIFPHAVGKKYPNGLLIVQDGFNYHGEQITSQNFKIIDLKQVIDLIPPKVQ